MPKITAMVCTDLPGLKVRTTPKATVITPKTDSSHHFLPSSFNPSDESTTYVLDIRTPSVRNDQ